MSPFSPDGSLTTTAAPPATAHEALAELARRIEATRRIPNPWSLESERGITGPALDALLRAWSTLDWPAQEARVRSLPWELCDTGEGVLRLIHQRAADPAAPAVVLLHGWPDSVLRFERVLPLLTDLNVVIPALPGFPFSPPLGDTTVAIANIASRVAAAMTRLGYDSYVVSGGDVGGLVAETLAASAHDHVAALHLTNLAAARVGSIDPSAAAPEVSAYASEVSSWRRQEGGFVAEQSTKPNTLIAALADSPAGLLAWIGEKLVGWSDGDDAFTAEELLTWVSAYWHTETAGTALSTYVSPTPLPARIDTPTVYSAFAHDIMPAPRPYLELFVNLAEYVHHGSGGHFAAWERPGEYAADLRRAVALAEDASR
ncbi:MAG: epoxide hydrolase [Leifsonia xyli]|nr:MAG: epoxide hydrolase [Leifsonia xyli]